MAKKVRVYYTIADPYYKIRCKIYLRAAGLRGDSFGDFAHKAVRN